MVAILQPPRIDLPKRWQGCVKSAVLYAIALAHYAIVYARAQAADSIMRGCDAFKDWCNRQGITPRFGVVGQHGSIALIERFILSLKNECTRIILVPLRADAFHLELTYFANWYNHNRPHSSLNGKTPHEVYHDLLPACECPRYEPRARWPRNDGFRFGAVTRYDLAVSLRLPEEVETIRTRTLQLYLEWNGSIVQRATNGGSKLADTGGHVGYLSPGIQWVLLPQLLIEGSLQIPLLQDHNGSKPDYGVRPAIGARFLFF